MRSRIILLAMLVFWFAAVTANPVFADTRGQPGDEGTHGDEMRTLGRKAQDPQDSRFPHFPEKTR